MISAIGYGLYTSGSALFFVKAADLSQSQVGLGFSLAGIVGAFISVRIGRLADRWGPRETALCFAVLLSLLMVAAVFVRDLWEFLPVIVCIGVAETAGNVAWGALIGHLVPKEDRVRLMARNRVLVNIGFSVGVLFAGVAIGLNTRLAYACLVLGMAVAAMLTAVLSLRLPRVPPSTAHGGSKRSGGISYDVPYIALSAVSSMTLIGNTILTVGLPLWVVTQTSLPIQLAAWMILGNTAIVILLQVKVSKGSDTVPGARRMQRRAFIVLAAACACAPLVHDLGPVPGAVVLLIVVALLTMGELWGESANWSFRFNFLDPRAQGAYSGMYILGNSIPTVTAPALVTFVTARFVPGGWFILAGVFMVGLLLNGPVIAWAERTRAASGTTAAELENQGVEALQEA
ncbi:MFS transporter [Streptomyces sannanensis]|uniref:MFS transporter n=1 Tax=Streptomyces sannanensis TaxID=285536 RepID=UPI0031E52531